MSAAPIYGENALARLKEALSAEMQKAAEPVIQAAVAEAEKVIRQRVAAMCVSLVAKDFSMERFGTDLRITVRGFGGAA